MFLKFSLLLKFLKPFEFTLDGEFNAKLLNLLILLKFPELLNVLKLLLNGVKFELLLLIYEGIIRI